MSTGCTPIVLAIRANHVDVVRELLSAGAIVPPPGLTNDPVMLSLLYPQPVYSMPPQFMGHQHQQHHPNMPPAEFYPPQPPAFYPQHMQQQQQQQANLPPADVSKTIPCRNFPNCKYGSACVFFHPRTQPGFYGYDQQQQQPPYFNPNNHNGFQPQQQQQHQLQHDTQHQTQQQQSASASDGSVPTASADHTTNTNDSNAPQLSINEHQQPPPQQQLSTAPPPFIPYGMASPPPPAQFGISPMSPPMMPMSPHDPAAAAFYASSPPSNGMMMPPMNGFVPRRQSINQGPNGYAGGKGFHGKKPSFSGGSRPFTNGTNGAANGNGSERRTSSWKDGNPPPCAFFAQGKCRNGEFCKFPHLDAEGTDCRHPDVIRGLLAPAPPLARVPRQMRMGNFSQYDPTRQFVPRAQQQQQQAPVMNGGVAGMEETATSPPIETVPESAPDAPVATEEAAAPEATPAQAQAQAPAPAPAKQQAAAPVVNGNTNGPNTNIARSASQPGVQRFQPNGHGHGFHSRSQSPAPSNVSFHGNGHPRRGGRPFNASVHQNGNSGRSVSAGENKQRVPSADEFPALGGLSLGASANTSPQERSTAQFQNSKTAAQVLSAPAPPKPEPPVPAQAQPSATEEDVSLPPSFYPSIPLDL